MVITPETNPVPISRHSHSLPLLSVLWVCLFCTFHVCGILCSVACCNWLPSFSIVCSGLSTLQRVYTPFLFTCQMCRAHCIYSLLNGWTFGWFLLLDCYQWCCREHPWASVYVWTCVFTCPGCAPGRVLAGPMVVLKGGHSVVPAATPRNTHSSCTRAPVPHTLPVSAVLCFLDGSCPSGYEVVSHRGSDFHFLDDQAWGASSHACVGHLCIQRNTCVSPCKLNYLSFVVELWELVILWILDPHQMCDLQILPSILWLSFHFLDVSLEAQKISSLIESHISIFSSVACSFGVISKKPLSNLRSQILHLGFLGVS